MDDLLKKVAARREQIEAYISRQVPRNKMLINIAVTCGIVGTALAGIPAIGGTGAIDTLKSFTQTALPIWQILCIGAALSTMAATIATTLRSNHDTSAKLTKAQACTARLEMLELLMLNTQIQIKDAIEKYGEYTAEVAFIR